MTNHDAGRTASHKIPKMVRLSLAVAALTPVQQVALAQVDVICTQNIRWGAFATCGGGGGQLVVTPQATSAVQTAGCLIVLGTPKRAVCKVAGLTSTTTGSLRIEIAPNETVKNGGITMAVSNYNIDTKSAGPTKVYTAATLTAKTFDFGIGARLDVGGGQTNGTYSGQVTLMVTYTP